LDDCTSTTIPANGSVTCSFTGPAPADDNATETDTVTANASDDDGNSTGPVTDTSVVTTADILPDITVLKTAANAPAEVPETGGDVTFTYEVTNNSTEAGTITVLSDNQFGPLTGDGDCQVDTVLAGGAFCSFEATFTIPAGDYPGSHLNVFSATVKDDDGNKDTDTDNEIVNYTDVLPDVTITKSADPTSVNEPGADVEFTIVVTNNSLEDATIDSLVDSDFDLAANCADAVGTVLASAASYTCTFTEFIAGNVGEDHQNTATVIASDNDGNTDAESDDADVVIENTAPAISIVKDGEATINEGGDTATYSFTITNNSVSTDPLTITSLIDDQFGDLLDEAEALYGVGPIILNQGDSFTFPIDRYLTLNVGETHTNVVTVVGVDDEGTEATDNDDHTVGADNVAPAVTIVKSGEATINEGGDTATYEFTITNNSVSTDPLTITSLIDNRFGDLLPDAEAANGGNPIVLASGQGFSFSIDLDLTLNAGETHTNMVTVVGEDDEGNEATDDDDHTVTGENLAPVINIEKDGEAIINEGGDTATYNFTITNNSVSTDPLTITSLNDNRFGNLLPEAETANGGAAIVLNPGESFSFSIDRDLILDRGETHTNRVFVIAFDDEGDEASDDDDHVVTGVDVAPVITVEKLPNQDQVFAPGEDVLFTIRVTNESVQTDPVTITSLEDDVFGDISAECVLPQTIGPGGSFECDITRTISSDHTNTVTATGVDDEGTPVSDSDDATVDMINPSVAVEKSTNGFDADAAPGPEILAGSAVNWAYVVTNDGDVALENVSVTDDQGVTVSCPQDTLAVGESMTCTASGTSVVGPYANLGTATATHTDADGDTANRTDDDPSHYFGAAPSIAIDKQTADDYGNEGDALGILPGETVTWNYYVTNDGNVPLENVSVTDSQGVTVTCPQDTLAVGESMTCTASGTATEGWYNNVGTASGDYSDDVGNSTTVTDEDGSSYYGLTPGTVTNSQLCDFGDNFRLLFTPDMQRFSSSTPFYKLSDSNPGQFFYNVFYVNDDSTSTVSMEIPYPFVTQGANPVHVYGGLFVDPYNTGNPTPDNLINCFDPVNELAAYGFTITLADYTDTNGDGEVGFGDVYLIDVPAELGFQYINIHLDYGLEKTKDWEKKGANVTNDGLNDPSLTDITINDNTDHTFNAYADGVLIPGSTDTVYNLNEFKQIRGFGGLVQYAGSLSPVVGAEVHLIGTDGNVIETMTTDSDGWYLSEYTHKGKAADYTLKLVSTGEETVVHVGGKVKFGEGNFLVP
jgi:uncharacterized repeat protein (TIGR01451 family)